MKTFYLYAAVSVSGASVLAIEILGTRLLGPFYGVSLFLWSALISVTLAALSAGYALGGRWADRDASYVRLALLLLGAGAWVLLTPYVARPVLVLSEPLGLRSAVLVATVVLFAPPFTLLGMVSPHTIRLKARSLEEVGRTAGDLYAISTVAGVVAALLTGFFLVPNVGVTNLLLLIGGLLVLTAAVGFAARSKAVGFAAVIVFAGLSTAMFIRHTNGSRSAVADGLVVSTRSAHAELRVVDANESRHLLIDGSVQTIVDPQTWRSFFPYVHVVELTKLFFDRPGRLLLIGLGGGSIAKRYADDGWKVDAVEFDPVVTELAREYFGFEETDATVYYMDGRAYLNSTDRMYDVIVMDAFRSGSIPFHLVTSEMFALAKSRLKPNGVLAINVEAVGWRDLLVRSVGATLAPRFSTVLALPIAEPPTRLGNLIFLASDSSLELEDEPPAPADRLSEEYNRVHAWDNRFTPQFAGAPILTDDKNPVDLWAERINLAARKNLHDLWGDSRVVW